MDLNTPTASKVVGGLSLLAIARPQLGPRARAGDQHLADTRLQVDSARQQNPCSPSSSATLQQQQRASCARRGTRRASWPRSSRRPPTSRASSRRSPTRQSAPASGPRA